MNEPNGPVKLVPTRSDAEIAADLRAKIEATMAPVLALMDEANNADLEIQFGTAVDQRRRNVLINLIVVKKF